MAKYTLNSSEIEIIKYISKHLVNRKDGLSFSFDIADACETLKKDESELIEALERFEDNYLITKVDGDSFILAQSVYDAVNEIKNVNDKEDEQVDKPFRLNSDTHNYDTDTENEYEEIELKFSDLRVDDEFDGEELVEEKVEDALSEDEEIEVKASKKKKNRKKGLSYSDFKFDEEAEMTDSGTLMPVNKDISVGTMPFADEVGAGGFKLNSDIYSETNVENVYKDQHIDFSDMRGGDIEGIEDTKEYSEPLEEGVLKKENVVSEIKKDEVRGLSSENTVRTILSQFSVTEPKVSMQKVTQEGETVKISSITEDNKGPVVSYDKGIIVDNGTFVKKGEVEEGFNSYNEKRVDNSTNNESVYAKGKSRPLSEQVQHLFDQNIASNMTTQPFVTVSKYKTDTVDEPSYEERRLKFDAVKRVDDIAPGFTQNSATLNNDAHIHTAKNMTGSVSGKIDYDIGNTKLESAAIETSNGFEGSEGFSGRTQDVEKNTDLPTAKKEARVETVKNFHTYDFAKLVTETGINELKSVSYNITTGIQGSYTDDLMPTLMATAGIGQAIAGRALYEIDKFNQAREDKAFAIAEKLNESGIDIGSISTKKQEELAKTIVSLGFTDKDADLFTKKVDKVVSEFSYRKEVVEKAKRDPMFLSGDEELKEYLKTKGFKGLSARKQVEILNELNLVNKNAEIRNLDLRRLNKRQLNKLLAKNGLDNKSKLILKKTKALQGKKYIENFAGNHGFVRSVLTSITLLRPSDQDLFGSTVKESYSKVRSTYGNVMIRISAVRIATDFAKKAYKMGNGFIRVGNGGFKKVGKRAISRSRVKDLKFEKLSLRGLAKGTAKAFTVGSILKAGKENISDSLYQIGSEVEEKRKKEKKEELTNKIAGAIDKKKTFEKISNKVAEKTGKTMKNATKEGFKKAGSEAVKKAGKEAAKTAVTAGTKAAATTAGTATASAGATAGAAAGTAAGVSAGAVAAIVIAIIVLIIIIIMFIMYMLDGIAMAGYEGSTVVRDKMGTFGADIGEVFSDGIKKMEHTAILVSDESTDNDEYVNIKKYLEKIQSLDEKREKDVLEFANAKIGTYSPESKGLEPYQMNGKYGQDSRILAGHNTQYYGSEDKKNGYTLHYLDAYGNEIANHSSNAKDVMALCAVIFSNQPDDDDVFPYLLEDQWYLMSPKIKWKESDIYCCDTCKYDGHNLTTCKGDNYSSKFKSNGEKITYHCNNYSEVSKVQNLIREGCKVVGDIRTYDHDGCEQREVSTWFYGDGYDTYDLYLDDYISYDDYRWYVDYYGTDIFSDRFYKYEDYCPGNHEVAVCYGHKDLDIYITLYDKEYAISKNIYPTLSTSHTGQYVKYEEYLEDFLDTDKWKDDENVKWVDDLYDQDWYDIYGLDVLGGVGFNIGGGLTDADIDSILDNLSDEELSIKQQAILEFALNYVGKIPYYWGGKASSLDFEANHFGTTVEADYKGRTRKGLDCSGFVQWVMANNGIKVPGSTAGFSKYSTTRDHSQLKVGDLGFCNVPGSNSNHVGIYAGQDENGNDLWVHCAGSSGTVVNNYNGFRYYISLGGL